MRPDIRSTTVGGVHWLVDRALCHPVAALTAIGGRLIGWPPVRCLLVGAVVDRILPSALARNPTPPARFLVLWNLACRFRRRWPDNLLAAGTALQRRVSLGPTAANVEDRSQPGDPAPIDPPALARLPRRIEGTTVAWDVELHPTADPLELGRHLHSLGLVDPRILSAEVEPRPDDLAGWMVVVDFDIEPQAWGLSVVDRHRAFVSIGSNSTARKPHEEGGSHGNG